MRVRAHVFVTGIVQGVFFRSHVRSQSKLKDVSGWVKNLPDGRVEAMVEGRKENVDAFLEILRKGPPGSRVDDLDISWEKPMHRFQGFDIRVD